ncbi:hypothetical protein GCM10020254_68230 [Streptomyces goshikiensis]
MKEIVTAGPALGGGGAEDDEDAGAQGGADADHGQLPHGERAAQRAALTLATLGDHLLDRLAAQQRVHRLAGLGGERWRLAGFEHGGSPLTLRVGIRHRPQRS